MFVCEILSRFTNEFEGGKDQIAKVKVATFSGKENTVEEGMVKIAVFECISKWYVEVVSEEF